jgi:hypothetical protein
MSLREDTLKSLTSSVANSFNELWSFRHEFEQSMFTSYDEAAVKIAMGWDPAFLPNFQFSGEALVSSQKDFFGCFALGEAIAEFLIGLESYGAHDILSGKDYDQYANFCAYNTSFHLIDSFLCLHGSFYIRDPVQGAAWKMLRRMDRPKRGTLVTTLEPVRLITPKRDRCNYVVATLNSNTVDWKFSPVNSGSVHSHRWRAFGELLLRILESDGIGSIREEIRQFFSYFAGRLSYLGVADADYHTVDGFRRMVRFACLDPPMREQVRSPNVSDLRNLSIYRNRTVDDYMRLVGKLLDPSVIGPIPKAVGLYFKRLAQGLIVSVGPLLNSVISKAKETLEGEPDSFRNGLESSFLMSNLVELDSSKIVDSQVYDHIDEDIRNLLKKYFGTQRYLPIPENIVSWQVGAAANPVFRMIRSPVTFGPALSPNPSWFPKPKE